MTTALEMLKTGFTPLQVRLNQGLLNELVQGFRGWEESGSLALRLIGYLLFRVQEEVEVIGRLEKDFGEFSTNFSRSVTDGEKEQHIMLYSFGLGTRGKDLRKDKRALTRRWLWFDTMQERYLSRVARQERRIVFLFGRLGKIISHFPPDREAFPVPMDYWTRLDLEDRVKPFFNYLRDPRLCRAALRCLRESLEVLPFDAMPSSVSEESVRLFFRFAQDPLRNVWVRCEAMALLKLLAPDFFLDLLDALLSKPQPGDHIFLRRRAIELMGDRFEAYPEFQAYLPLTMRDPSPFVRQVLPKVLRRMPVDFFKPMSRLIALNDTSHQVRAAMVLELSRALGQEDRAGICSRILGEVLRKEEEPFVLRTALKAACDGTARMTGQYPGGSVHAETWFDMVIPEVETLADTSENAAVVQWARRALEEIWCLTTPGAVSLRRMLEPLVRSITPGSGRLVSRKRFSGYTDEYIGRVLAVITQGDYGVEIRKGLLFYEVFRGWEFGFRFWRFWHEFFHPAPDKRQAFRHTVGRIPRGHLRAPSSILAETTSTRVPGEPLVIEEEQGWRPYLPLPDDALSMFRLSLRRPHAEIYSFAGITYISGPRSWFKRLWGRIRLSLSFTRLADLRNWERHHQEPPRRYLETLASMGMETQFEPYPHQRAVPGINRFFPAMVPLGELWGQLKDYFFSIYENSFVELILFTIAAITVFVGRHLFLNIRQRRMRREIPLVIGGWGTRGKSGTERCKAALMNALGYSLVSKTTGSEATFLYAPSFGELREIPIFRPYEKATIWEQYDVTRIANGLGVDVFLWECMALQPDYVEVLQRSWMKDDVATITNTFPDHEDVMGPAGIDIPKVMTRFIPKKSKLITSEEWMYPVLEEGARRFGSSIKPVTWLEAGLLTDDVLERFPYSEHPNNVALVLSMAEELGIEKDFALKEMADRAVPEIGMLKTFPIAGVGHCRLEFTNGMAANERMGFMSNWKRTGFDTHDDRARPGEWLSTVVNNRADRIPRSQVFADILAADISADRYFLIGNNLTGLSGYIDEAWERYAGPLRLWPEETVAARDGGEDVHAREEREREHGNHEALALLERMARKLRMPVNEVHIRTRLKVMLEHIQEGETDEYMNSWDQPEHLAERLGSGGTDPGLLERVTRRLAADLEIMKQFEHLAQAVETAGPGEQGELERLFQETIRGWFQRKIVVIWDYHATGDTVVSRICGETPPGFLNRIMGVQNIKGTGTDFVNVWQQWETCYLACNKLLSDDESVAGQGLTLLSGFRNFNLLCETTLEETLEKIKPSPIAQGDRFQATLMIIRSNFQVALDRVRAGLNRETVKRGIFFRFIDWVEGFLDSNDAVKRKKKSDKIYRDLVLGRIAVSRAVAELTSLMKRQKGGWLSQYIRSGLEVFKKK